MYRYEYIYIFLRLPIPFLTSLGVRRRFAVVFVVAVSETLRIYFVLFIAKKYQTPYVTQDTTGPPRVDIYLLQVIFLSVTKALSLSLSLSPEGIF